MKLNYINPANTNYGENFEDYYVEIRELKKGDVFFECENGSNIQLEATEDARKIKRGWMCLAKNNQGEQVELYVADKTKYHGPNFFKSPQFITNDEEAGYVYMIA